MKLEIEIPDLLIDNFLHNVDNNLFEEDIKNILIASCFHGLALENQVLNFNPALKDWITKKYSDYINLEIEIFLNMNIGKE